MRFGSRLGAALGGRVLIRSLGRCVVGRKQLTLLTTANVDRNLCRLAKDRGQRGFERFEKIVEEPFTEKRTWHFQVKGVSSQSNRTGRLQPGLGVGLPNLFLNNVQYVFPHPIHTTYSSQVFQRVIHTCE